MYVGGALLPSSRMRLVVLACSLALCAEGQRVDDDWVDPFDMLNYDASSKTMKKPVEAAHYDNVATRRRAHTHDPGQEELALCSSQVLDLQKRIEEQKKKASLLSQQPTCNPVFKRYFSRLLKEIQRVGLPSDSSDAVYDAKIRLSKQAVTEIEALLDGEDNWRTGALDCALNQILVDLKPHDYEAWKWRFEDTFGVELDTLLKMGLCVMVLMAIICTQLWSTVSWFVQFRRLFAVCFVVSFVWNWFYLYKIAFAEHQNNMVKMSNAFEKCTGVKKIDWSDSLKEIKIRGQKDQTCNNNLIFQPKALSITITTFITEPMKHIGQGISEFLRALLKDLPVTLQIPVLLTIVLSIMLFMYGSAQAVFQHGIMAPFRRPRRDPSPPRLQQPQPQIPGIEGIDHLAGGDAQQQVPRRRANDGRLHRNQVHQRHANRPREVVETLLAAGSAHSEDETDAEWREGTTEAEHNLSADSDSGNQLEAQEEPAGAMASGVAAHAAQAKTKRRRSDPSQSKTVKVSENRSRDESSGELRSQLEGKPPAQTDITGPGFSAGDGTSSVSVPHVEIIGVSVQESCPAAAAAGAAAAAAAAAVVSE